PNEKAGRPAKCPKCGVGFRIPTIEELGLGKPAVADASLGGAEVADGSAAAQSLSGVGKQPAAAAPPAKEAQIEFLCPNGHHLHGPASLQGRAGECPECGSRFRIPVIDQPEGEADTRATPGGPAEEEITLDSSKSSTGRRPAESAESLDFLQVLDGGNSRAGKTPGASGQLGDSILDLSSGPGGVAQPPHSLAALFMELWAARGEGSRVEVHLESGSVLVPDGYLKPHSQRDYAVLVTRDPDGCSTITVVPWGSISRIILRAVKQVPGE